MVSFGQVNKLASTNTNRMSQTILPSKFRRSSHWAIILTFMSARVNSYNHSHSVYSRKLVLSLSLILLMEQSGKKWCIYINNVNANDRWNDCHNLSRFSWFSSKPGEMGWADVTTKRILWIHPQGFGLFFQVSYVQSYLFYVQIWLLGLQTRSRFKTINQKYLHLIAIIKQVY